MAFFTEIGKKYNVTGVMGGWDNYTPANPDDEHARGESTGAAVLQLKGKQIEVTSHEHRVEEGYPDNQGGPYAPYEVVKVKEVGGDETEYYAWVVYNGDINVEEIVEQEDPPVPPDPVTDPDPPVDPPKPDEDIINNGTEVHVRAGQTTVLDVLTNGKNNTDSGILEVSIEVKEGESLPKKLYCFNATKVWEILLNNEGKGILENLPAGQYQLAQEEPETIEAEEEKLDQIIVFQRNSDQISNNAKNVVHEIISTWTKSGEAPKLVKFKGFAQGDIPKVSLDNLKLKRAIAVRNLFQNELEMTGLKVQARDVDIGKDENTHEFPERSEIWKRELPKFPFQVGVKQKLPDGCQQVRYPVEIHLLGGLNISGTPRRSRLMFICTILIPRYCNIGLIIRGLFYMVMNLFQILIIQLSLMLNILLIPQSGSLFRKPLGVVNFL